MSIANVRELTLVLMKTEVTRGSFRLDCQEMAVVAGLLIGVGGNSVGEELVGSFHAFITAIAARVCLVIININWWLGVLGSELLWLFQLHAQKTVVHCKITVINFLEPQQV